LVSRLSLDWDLAVRAVRGAEAAEEEAEEMVYFSDGCHSAFTAAARVSLFDANGWGNPEDVIDVWACELIDELTRVGVHGVEESTLTLGEEEVEGEGAFTGAAYAGDHHKTAARDPERDILEIVFACAQYSDGVGER
jgi:hypothetical protein